MKTQPVTNPTSAAMTLAYLIVITALVHSAGCATTDTSGAAQPSTVVSAPTSTGEIDGDDSATDAHEIPGHTPEVIAAIASAEERHGKQAIITENGLAYIDIVVGDGPSPTLEGRVVAHYIGSLIDGTRFENSHDRGRPGTFGIGILIPGCTEGLSTMKVGGKRLMIIPAQLGYGTKRRPAAVPEDAPLMFEFELLDLAPPDAPSS